MELKGFAGRVGRIPISGAYVDISSADADVIFKATSGLIKTGLAVGLAAGVLGLVTKELVVKKSSIMPITSLAKLKFLGKSFVGVCIAEELEFYCNRQKMTIPTNVINSISANFNGSKLRNDKNFCGYDICLIDGSIYKYCNPVSEYIPFITIVGKQEFPLFLKTLAKKFFCKKEKWIPFYPGPTELIMDIDGATVDDVELLRKNLNLALERNIDGVIDSVGEDVFKKYFCV